MVEEALQQDRPIGKPNGTGQRAFDRWFRYPAGFSVETMQMAFDRSGAEAGATVVDCFAGVATTGVHAVGQGCTFVGIEGNPLIAELASLKVRKPVIDGSDLKDACSVLLERMPSGGASDLAGEHDLIVRCFGTENLGELVWLRDQIASMEDAVGQYLMWALVATLRDSAEVKTGWPYQLPATPRRTLVSSVAKGMAARTAAIADDIDSWDAEWGAGTVIGGDSRSPDAWTSMPADADACITSPPYLNNYDYLDAIRLELYFLGRAESWADLLQTARSNLVAATTHHATEASAQTAREELRELGAESLVTTLADQLAVERKRRPRGKEYDRMLLSYAGDMAKVLKHLRGAMRSDGKAVFVVGDSAPYGVYIDTPDLIASLGAAVGFREVSSSLVRNRGLRWRTNGSRHQVELAERMLVLEAN
jgi:hypothetical protein